MAGADDMRRAWLHHARSPAPQQSSWWALPQWQTPAQQYWESRRDIEANGKERKETSWRAHPSQTLCARHHLEHQQQSHPFHQRHRDQQPSIWEHADSFPGRVPVLEVDARPERPQSSKGVNAQFMSMEVPHPALQVLNRAHAQETHRALKWHEEGSHGSFMVL